ncbi:hypothetical protein KP77_08280 [Jeotgalibacillus alimentarius]|uniref:Uncharacterized protein n=1 Tax=Jeotgalibacillus alimentarius TaxID=135826 RepID=A0A0C2W3X4_9BACL|nr:hypothetical protein [Jeotgalibacillus alimentarius]KIL51316.1 hypothetical protein KP77_08280 [Jeotgalibacillus alimentarius]
MSKEKLPERINWPVQSEFSSGDRNAVWEKINKKKKRTNKWLPISLSGVAAAAALILVIQLTGVEEQDSVPLDQPEKQEEIEETVETETEDTFEQTEEIDLRTIQVGDTLNGWTATYIVAPENNKGGSFILFEKQIELTGEISFPEGSIQPVFEPKNIAEDTFPVQLNSNKMQLIGYGLLYEKIYGIEDQNSAEVTMVTGRVFIGFDPADGSPESGAMLEPDFGPPFTQFDPASVDERLYAGSVLPFDGYDYQGISEVIQSISENPDDQELRDLSPVNIIRVFNSTHNEARGILFSEEADYGQYAGYEELSLALTNGPMYEFLTFQLVEVHLSETESYVAAINRDGETMLRVYFKFENDVWKITSVQEV